MGRAAASSNLNDFNYLNKALTAKLLKQSCRYFKLRKAFLKFYRRHSAFVFLGPFSPASLFFLVCFGQFVSNCCFYSKDTWHIRTS